MHAVPGKAADFLHEVRISVVNGGSAELPNYVRGLRRTGSVHFHPGELPQLEECSADAARGAVNQHALAGLGVSRTVQHLVGSDVVQDECDSFGRIQPLGHGNEFALTQANVLCVTAADRHGRNRLAQSETGDAFADLIDNADQVPTWRRARAVFPDGRLGARVRPASSRPRPALARALHPASAWDTALPRRGWYRARRSE